MTIFDRLLYLTPRVNGPSEFNPSTIVPTYGAGRAPIAGSTLRCDFEKRDLRFTTTGRDTGNAEKK